MLLFAVLQVAAPAPQTAPPLPEEDVVVIGRRLDRWSGAISTNPLGTRCTTKTSSGDREIDAIGCAVMKQCWPDMLPRLKAANAKGIDKADRQRLIDGVDRDMGACVKPRRAALIEDLRARRAAARGAGA